MADYGNVRVYKTDGGFVVTSDPGQEQAFLEILATNVKCNGKRAPVTISGPSPRDPVKVGDSALLLVGDTENPIGSPMESTEVVVNSMSTMPYSDFEAKLAANRAAKKRYSEQKKAIDAVHNSVVQAAQVEYGIGEEWLRQKRDGDIAAADEKRDESLKEIGPRPSLESIL